MVPIMEKMAANLVYQFAMTVACPTCAQQPGEPCLDWHDSADPSRYTEMLEPHPGRVECAQFKASVEAGDGGGQVHEATEAQIDDAATERLF